MTKSLTRFNFTAWIQEVLNTFSTRFFITKWCFPQHSPTVLKKNWQNYWEHVEYSGFTDLYRLNSDSKRLNLPKNTWMKKFSLGIGSRVRHPQHGDGWLYRLNLRSTLWHSCNTECGTLTELTMLSKLLIWMIRIMIWVSLADIEVLLVNIIKNIQTYRKRVEIGQKWTGGTMILKPGDTSTQIQRSSDWCFLQ